MLSCAGVDSLPELYERIELLLGEQVIEDRDGAVVLEVHLRFGEVDRMEKLAVPHSIASLVEPHGVTSWSTGAAGGSAVAGEVFERDVEMACQSAQIGSVARPTWNSESLIVCSFALGFDCG